MDCLSLDRLPLGATAVVHGVQAGEKMRQRLMDLGFVNGGLIRARLRSAAGDPTAYEIRGTLIALRNEDSRGILVIIMEMGDQT